MKWLVRAEEDVGEEDDHDDDITAKYSEDV